MSIDLVVVRRIAALAHLSLAPEEEASLAEELARILDYVDILQSVPTEGVPVTTHAVDIPSRLDDDVPREGLSRDAALASAAEADLERGLFRVPRVV